MNFSQAIEKMKRGKVVRSQVSNIAYKFKGYILCAGGILVDFDYITDAEADGHWEEVSQRKWVRKLDIDWKFQQENALLRKELALLKKENVAYRVTEIASGIPPVGRFFTDIQLDFIKTNNLDYGRIYSLAVKYGNVKDSLVEVWEESYES